MDSEKVSGFELCANGEPCIGEKFMKCPFSPRNNKEQNCGVTMAQNAMLLLKEQQQKILELGDQVEYLTDKQKERKFLVDSDGKITPLPDVVRCKDCKHRPKEVPYKTTWGATETYLDFPYDSKCPCQCPGDTYYSWNPDDEWFCAEGERR